MASAKDKANLVAEAIRLTGFCAGGGAGVVRNQDGSVSLVWDAGAGEPMHEVRHDDWRALFASLSHQIRRDFDAEQADAILAASVAAGVPREWLN